MINHRACAVGWRESRMKNDSRAIRTEVRVAALRKREAVRLRRGQGVASKYLGVVAAAATGLLRGPLRFRPLRGPAAPPYTSLDLARSTR
jgi:hypothetical protein